MAANSYYNSHVPMDNSHKHNAHISQASSTQPLTMATPEIEPKTWYEEHQQLGKQDSRLKKRIRLLRVLQRVLAMAISIAALVPIAMTLNKYLNTRGITRPAPNGQGGTIERTAWALKTKAWPTYMYFATAVVSTTVHLFVLLGYAFSVRVSNVLDTIGTTIVTIELCAQLVLWAVVAAIYKYEKERTENGRHNDLWGWSCSGAAQAIQNTFEDVVPFNSYCDIQSASWYAGLVQVGAIILALLIMVLAWKRKKTKENVRRSTTRGAMLENAGYRVQPV